MVMPEINYQLLHNYADHIQNWGWICNIHSQASRSFTRCNYVWRCIVPSECSLIVEELKQTTLCFQVSGKLHLSLRSSRKIATYQAIIHHIEI
ncbi:hypothetical protein H5410_008383 [Solanum commersonii]|uniref:Uncharacterized protein n=1 Tax=Solanum commersonii TaxID=4109 RepID=A0A9J6AET3_SOLCO|nr:hypothetical protein H5410_008383 [Solanum commersonii]